MPVQLLAVAGRIAQAAQGSHAPVSNRNPVWKQLLL